MSPPQVSVIIPTYNRADYLAEAIQSVLNQTFEDFEVIIVDDSTQDHTREVVGQFADPHIRYLFHEKSRGLAAARNEGIRASSGAIIAFLDPNDLFHPEKIETHVAFFERNPDVGATYNAHFETDASGTILSMWRPPSRLTFSDLVLGLPISPGGMVLRRDWAISVADSDESCSLCGEALDIYGGLALAGCQFASVDRALNYHRRCPERDLQNLTERVETAVLTQETVFSDPRCPQEVLALREQALGKTYMIWSYQAFVQNEASLGQELIRKSIQLDRSILDMQAHKYLEFLVLTSIGDGGEHEPRLRRVFEQLPPELAWITLYRDWSVARGYLYRGVRDIIWGRLEKGVADLTKASALGARLDKPYCYALLDQLTEYEAEFGPAATEKVLQRLSRYLGRIGKRTDMRWFKGAYFVDRAFRDYRQGNYAEVPNSVFRAVSSNPTYVANRGVWAILFRSLTNSAQQVA